MPDRRFKTGVTPEHKPGGYPRMSCGPQVNKFVHVLVVEGMLGRKLLPHETIHHKDGDVKNPHWSNLLVIDVRTHGAVSAKQHWYLKQKYSREEAAWKAYFDVTGKDVNNETLRVPIVPDAAGSSRLVSA